MKTAKKIEGRYCPKCGSIDNQIIFSKNKSGTQRCKCNKCGKTYTLNPKTRALPGEVRRLAIKKYKCGLRVRKICEKLDVSKSTVYNWLNNQSEEQGEPDGEN
jgi:transposase-like protein